MKDALPLHGPADDTDDTDDKQPKGSEAMKGGISATATGGSPEALAPEGSDAPKD
jgi:hypothetical protein